MTCDSGSPPGPKEHCGSLRRCDGHPVKGPLGICENGTGGEDPRTEEELSRRKLQATPCSRSVRGFPGHSQVFLSHCWTKVEAIVAATPKESVNTSQELLQLLQVRPRSVLDEWELQALYPLRLLSIAVRARSTSQAGCMRRTSR